jgi:hypothetical protein
MDVLAELRAAIERLAELRRRAGGGRPRKQKKVKMANRRPAKMGPSVGCGTGAGGFKAGNQCAKEDGIPQKPLSQGGALKKANAKDDIARAKALREKAAAKKAKKEVEDKAKSEAARPQREAKDKAKKIEYLRRKAAERKAQKGERDAAEKQAAAEAAAKKRAAMLQKIRVKKANERIQIAGTPKSIKQELQELKLARASLALKVVGTPKSIREELESLKARLAAGAKPPQSQKPAQKAGTHAGESLLQKSKDGWKDENADKDRDLVFGANNREAWKNPHSNASDALREQVKVSLSLSAAKRLESMGIKEDDIDDGMLLLFDKTSRYYGSTAAAERLVKQGVPAKYHRRYALSAGMVDSWAGTSGDSVAKAVGLQYAIKDEFGVSKAYTRHLSPKNKSKAGKDEWDDVIARVRSNKGVRAVLRAHYEQTQDHLRSAGISQITLVRGYRSQAKVDLAADQNVSLQPASSFSMSKKIAGAFGNDSSPARRRLVTVTVPAGRVFSICTTGFGCLSEQELVVLGGVIRGRVRMKETEW